MRKEAALACEDVLGFIGGALITTSLIPQVVRLYRLKSAREISLLFNSLFLLGGICWLFYGIVQELFPVILWNAIGLILIGAMLIAKLKYSKYG